MSDKQDIDHIAAEAADYIKTALLDWARLIGHVMPLPDTFNETNKSIIKAACEKATVNVVNYWQGVATQEWHKGFKTRKEGDASCEGSIKMESQLIGKAAPNVQPVAAAAGQEKWTAEWLRRVVTSHWDEKEYEVICRIIHNATLQQSDEEIRRRFQEGWEEGRRQGIELAQSDDTKRLDWLEQVQKSGRYVNQHDYSTLREAIDAAIASEKK